MKRLKIIVLCAVVMAHTGGVLRSQTLQQLLNNPNLTYFDIQQQLESNKSILENATPKEKKRYNRWKTFWDTRVDHQGKFTTFGQAMYDYSKNLPSEKNNNHDFESMGPRLSNIGGTNRHIGRVNAIWVNPANIDEIVIGTNNAGVWKSYNGGQSWDHKTPEIWCGVSDIEVDNTRGIMYIGTRVYANGLLHHGRYGLGIFKSLDWGETWEALDPNILPENMVNIAQIIVTNDGTKMYKVTGDGVYVSQDQGETFTQLLSSNTSNYEYLGGLRLNPVNQNHMAIGGDAGFYTSVDGGATWVSRYAAVQNFVSIQGRLVIAVDYSNSGTLWVNATNPSNDFSSVLTSTNNGNSWNPTVAMNEPIGAIVGGSVYIEAFSDDLVYAGGAQLYKITANGSIKEPSTGYPNVHNDIRDICIPIPSNPNLVYIVTDGGVNRNTTGGVGSDNWPQIYGNLALNECYKVSVVKGRVAIGTHDNGTYYANFASGFASKNDTISDGGGNGNGTTPSNNAGFVWEDGGDGGAVLLKPNSDEIYLYRSNGGLWKRTKDAYGQVCTTSVAYMGGNLDSPLLSHPANANTAYIASNRDGGYSVINKTTNWIDFPYNASNPRQGSWGWAWGEIKSMDISPANPNNLYYVANGSYVNSFSLFKNQSLQGQQGTNIRYNLPAINARITSISVHPSNENIVWVTFGNFDAGNKVFQLDQTTNTWTNISHNLPNIPVNNVKYHMYSNTLFLATDAGLYQLTNALPLGSNQTWERCAGFPFVITTDIQINTMADIVVATYGRGLWKSNLNCISDTDVETISVNTTWSASKAVTKTVEILPGKTLTVNSGVIATFPPEAKIIVRPGAQLKINGTAKLTSSCKYPWHGVVLLGNETLSQTTTNQSKLIVGSNAVIENAKYGVYAGNPDVPGTGGGGIIEIQQARFVDCEYGVYMSPYSNPNVGYIKYTGFQTTYDYLRYGEKPYAHLFLHGIKGLTIFGNRFENLSSAQFEATNRGYGIVLKEANVTIGGTTKNDFRNLYRGVWNLSSSGFSDVQIINNTFQNNFTAIEMAGFYKGKASGNTITLGDYGWFGFMMSNLEHFRIENNTITGNGRRFGMFVQYSTLPNEIYKNTFNNLGYGFYGYSNPSLKLTCNVFNGNMFQILASNDGISPSQGTISMPAGNIFIPDCSGSETELKATEIYYKRLSYFYFNNPLADEEPLCHNEHVRLYETTVQNGCSSKEPSEPEVLEARYQELNSSIGEQENNLEQLVDGGSTPKTVNAIENVNEGQEINLMSDLLDKSPFLSEEALVKTAVEEDVLPAIIVANVLEANPQAAKSVVVQTALDNRAEPMPDYLRQLIDQGLDVVSAKEELEMALGENKMLKEQVLSDIITAYLNDETTDRSADAEALMLAENSASYDYLMVNRYLSTNRITEAQTLFNAMPGKYGFSDAQMAEYNQMAQIVAIHVALGHANYFELTAEQKAQLYLLAEDGATRAGALARGILVLVDRAEFPVPEITIPEGGNKIQRIPTEAKPVFSFTVQPNPANDYFVVDYNLATKDFETAELRLFNNQGKQVYQQKLTKQAFQLLITTEQFEPGIYLCRLYKDSKEVAANPLVIKPNQLIDPQAVEQSEQLLEGQQFFLVYPNPTTVDVTVCSSRTENCTIEVYDERGQVVNRLSKVAATNTINTRGLKPGVYHVRLVENGKVVETVKLVVQ